MSKKEFTILNLTFYPSLFLSLEFVISDTCNHRNNENDKRQVDNIATIIVLDKLYIFVYLPFIRAIDNKK